MKGMNHGVRPWSTGYEDAATNVRIAGADFADDGERGIVRFVGGEKNFVVGIVLAEKTFDILFQLRFQAMNRFEHGDWRQVRVVRNGAELTARVGVEANRADQREAEKYGRRQRAGYGYG